MFDGAKLGQSFQAKRRIIFRRDGELQWYYAQNHLKDSALIAWPCTVHKIRGTQIEYYEPDTIVTEVNLVSVYDIKLFSAREVEFKSWAWQRTNYHGAKTAPLRPAIRLFAMTPVEPYYKLCLRKAFWGMNRSWMEDITRRWGFAWNKDGTYFETMFDGIRSGMKWSENKTMDAMSQVMSPDALAEHFDTKIIGLDEAFEVLEEQDLKVANGEQDNIETARANRNSFEQEFKTKWDDMLAKDKKQRWL